MSAVSNQEVKQALWEILDQLPEAQRHQVLDFARFLRQQMFMSPPVPAETEHVGALPPQEVQLHLVPATSLLGLTGLVSLGGDAVADTEALYNGDHRS